MTAVSNQIVPCVFPNYSDFPEDSFCYILQNLDAKSLLSSLKVAKSWRDFITSCNEQYAFLDAALTIQAIEDSSGLERVRERMFNLQLEQRYHPIPQMNRTKEDWLDSSFWLGPHCHWEGDYLKIVEIWPAKDHLPEPLCALFKNNMSFFIELLKIHLERKPMQQRLPYHLSVKVHRMQEAREKAMAIFFCTLMNGLLEVVDFSRIDNICLAWNIIDVMTQHMMRLCPKMVESCKYTTYRVSWQTAISERAFSVSVQAPVDPLQGQKDSRIIKLESLLCSSNAVPKQKLLVLNLFSSRYTLDTVMRNPIDPNFCLNFKELLENQIKNTNDKDFIRAAHEELIIVMSKILFWHLQQGHGITHEIFNLQEFTAKIGADILGKLISALCNWHTRTRNLEFKNDALKLFDKLLAKSVFQDVDHAPPSETNGNLSILDDDWFEDEILFWADRRDMSNALQQKWSDWKRLQQIG